MSFTSEKSAEDILDEIVGSLDVRKSLAAAAEGLGKALQVSRVLVLVPCAAPMEWSAATPDPALDRALINLAHYLKRSLAQAGRPLVIPDAARHTLLDPVRGECEALGVASLLAFSADYAGTAEAAILLFECNTPRSWDERCLATVKRVAHHLAASVHHARLARETEAGVQKQVPDRSLASIVHYDAKGSVQFINPRLCQLLGLDGEELRGRSFAQVLELSVLESDRPRVIETYSKAFRAKTSTVQLKYRVVHRRSGQVLWVLDQLGPIEGGFESVALNITHQEMAEEQFRRSEARYQRLVEHSDAIIFHTDADHIVTFISRRALDFFGMSPEDFLAEPRLRWFDLVHPEDYERVRALAGSMHSAQSSFDEEFRVINRVTGRVRWLLARLVPVLGPDGTLSGWDGFGVDISGRRDAQEALDIQSKKIRALYTVSSAIRGYLDPSNIASRGLAALCDATGAGTGLCYIFSPRNQHQLQLIAHYGFSQNFEEKKAVLGNIAGLAAYVARNGQSLVIPDIGNDPRADVLLTEEESVRSAVLVPIAAEEEILGTIGLFGREASQFDGGTVMLVSAAANQIGLAARQANLFALYRKQTKNLSALYRVSHELSRKLSLEELFQNAFSIIRDELGLKRLWLGLLNEAETRIVGQAAYGPGWRRRLVGINIDVSGREHALARVVSSRSPVVLTDPEEMSREFGVKKIFSRLAIHSVAIVPILGGGQVLGVLAVQPGSSDVVFGEDEIALLQSLASEIGVNLLTRRLEERIAEGEKMRAAGLLAAGIAHNFNNVLQAIMGQASLLEMQRDSNPRIEKAARIINEAATKGASLVKQLSSFAHLEEPRKEQCSINDIIDRGKESFQRFLGPSHLLQLSLSQQLPRVSVDSGQVLRIVLTLVSNAVDAMPAGGQLEIFSDRFVVDEKNPHYEVPYGTYIRLGVRDTGTGMDEETRRRCFEPFFTTKNLDRGSGLSVTGAGLGLAAAYALARRNNGRLVAESKAGKGSIFILYLPVDSADGHDQRRPTLSGQLEVEKTDGKKGTVRPLKVNGPRPSEKEDPKP